MCRGSQMRGPDLPSEPVVHRRFAEGRPDEGQLLRGRRRRVRPAAGRREVDRDALRVWVPDHAETGLFRTQKADGIMGMSMHAQTLVPTMRQANKLGHNSFAMCFMQGGGTMALGGSIRASTRSRCSSYR